MPGTERRAGQDLTPTQSIDAVAVATGLCAIGLLGGASYWWIRRRR